MSPYVYLLPLIVWVGVLVVCVLCMYIAWRALFSDRGRSQRRCPKCWYDLSYSPGMQCAECGYVAQKESEFQRTRRRPGVAAAAIFICVALVVGINDQMNQQGFLHHFPTRVLLWMLPVAGGMDGSVGHEIDRRASSRQLTADQWITLVQRCAKGDWTARPPSGDWIDDYGNFIQNWRNRFINDPQLEAPLSTIPPQVAARTRERWPQGAPVVVAVHLEDWWPAGMECRVRATQRVAPGEMPAVAPLTFYRSGEIRFRPTPFTMYLPPLPPGDHQIIIDFQVDRRRVSPETLGGRSMSDPEAPAGEEEPDDLPWESVGTYSVTLNTRIEGSVADMTKPVSSAALDAALAQVFGSAVRWTGGGRSPVRFGINAQNSFTPEFNDTAVGVKVELERDGVVARRLNLWWVAGDNVGDDKRNYGFEINYEDIDLLRQLTADDTGSWLLRVRSDPLLALRAGVTKQCWQGEFTTPVNLRLNTTQAPPRMWWTDGEQKEPPAPGAEPARRGGRRAQ